MESYVLLWPQNTFVTITNTSCKDNTWRRNPLPTKVKVCVQEHKLLVS